MYFVKWLAKIWKESGWSKIEKKTAKANCCETIDYYFDHHLMHAPNMPA